MSRHVFYGPFKIDLFGAPSGAAGPFSSSFTVVGVSSTTTAARWPRGVRSISYMPGEGLHP